ncbi:tyrosine-type recombinase/integrase [Hansschlegelia zhihuaiae]|uniref:Integrase n=1 Tax=Hansschlegelia zhihuaiae TaxID=405005 RepID=A0A4Q0MBM5_9HYPH|nr:tyrosine-type recombinase/integrase [Hansschlegelia zhihuaiae]RXF70259.1 integrase [Hansschlegelia zhihuaiae]
MPASRTPRVNTVRRKLATGEVATYHYHRDTGDRLDGEPGTPEFARSWADAEERRRNRTGGTLAGIIRDWENSAEHRARAVSTRAEYKRITTAIDAKFGTVPAGALVARGFRRDVLAWRDELAIRTPREADNRVTILASVLAWAADRGHIEANVLQKWRRVYKSDRSEKIWLPEHVAAFLKAAPDELAPAMMLALHTGQRRGDLLKLPWSAYDGSALTLRQGKGGRRVVIPCTAALRATLDGQTRRGPLILVTKTARAWSARYFAAQWDAAAKAAGVADLHFHDLRGTAITMLAEADCTVPQIASITGHSLRSVDAILEKYLPRTRALAEQAIAKLENSFGTKSAKRSAKRNGSTEAK